VLAFNWYRKAAVCDDAARTYINLWKQTDERQTPVKVIAALQRVSHHPVAQNLLGWAYEFGIGMAKDEKVAVDW
jgi:TPR repeat protein